MHLRLFQESIRGGGQSRLSRLLSERSHEPSHPTKALKHVFTKTLVWVSWLSFLLLLSYEDLYEHCMSLKLAALSIANPLDLSLHSRPTSSFLEKLHSLCVDVFVRASFLSSYCVFTKTGATLHFCYHTHQPSDCVGFALTVQVINWILNFYKNTSPLFLSYNFDQTGFYIKCNINILNLYWLWWRWFLWIWAFTLYMFLISPCFVCGLWVKTLSTVSPLLHCSLIRLLLNLLILPCTECILFTQKQECGLNCRSVQCHARITSHEEEVWWNHLISRQPLQMVLSVQLMASLMVDKLLFHPF